MTTTSAFIRLCAPIVIWAVHFLAIYAFTAIACARGFAQMRVFGVEAVTLAIAVATFAAATAALLVIATAVRRRARNEDETRAFVRWTSAAVSALVLVAVIWEALPVLIVAGCG